VSGQTEYYFAWQIINKSDPHKPLSTAASNLQHLYARVWMCLGFLPPAQSSHIRDLAKPEGISEGLFPTANTAHWICPSKIHPWPE